MDPEELNGAPPPDTPLPSPPPEISYAAQPPAPRYRPRYLVAFLLFVASLLTTTTLGAVAYLLTRTDTTTDLSPLLSPATVIKVWTTPELLRLGFSFSLPLLFILLCHELGHYLMCRRYGLSATLPYFIPAPLALGTFGAFIKIRSPIRNKRQLFDVGVAGPIAGFVALLPFLIYGVAHSQPAVVFPAPAGNAGALLFVPGRCLAVLIPTWIFHGRLVPGAVLDLHPFALAAWFGLLATALNLIPLSQLDGGHILYAVTGRLQRRLALPLWVLLVVAGLIWWNGWFFWCLLVLLMGLRHPRVVDEARGIGAGRRWIAALALVLLILSFMPVPARVVTVGSGPVSGSVLAAL